MPYGESHLRLDQPIDIDIHIFEREHWRTTDIATEDEAGESDFSPWASKERILTFHPPGPSRTQNDVLLLLRAGCYHGYTQSDREKR